MVDFGAKLGPLPVWGWMLAGGGGIALLMMSRGATAGSGSGGVNTGTIPGTNTGGSVGGGGTGTGTGTVIPPVVPPVVVPPVVVPPVVRPPSLPALFARIGTFFSGNGPVDAVYIGDTNPAGWLFVGIFDGLRGYIRDTTATERPPQPPIVAPPIPPVTTGGNTSGNGRGNGGSTNTLIRHLIGQFPTAAGLIPVYDMGSSGDEPVGLYNVNGNSTVGYISGSNPNNATGWRAPAELMNFLYMFPFITIPSHLWPPGWHPNETNIRAT